MELFENKEKFMHSSLQQANLNLEYITILSRGHSLWEKFTKSRVQ